MFLLKSNKFQITNHPLRRFSLSAFVQKLLGKRKRISDDQTQIHKNQMQTNSHYECVMITISPSSYPHNLIKNRSFASLFPSQNFSHNSTQTHELQCLAE